jgi:aprataxin
MSDLTKSQYEPLLKDDLSCWRCGEGMKNMPTLKAHLQEEWDNERKREKAKLAKKEKTKRNLPEDEDAGPASKRQELEVGES